MRHGTLDQFRIVVLLLVSALPVECRSIPILSSGNVNTRKIVFVTPAQIDGRDDLESGVQALVEGFFNASGIQVIPSREIRSFASSLSPKDLDSLCEKSGAAGCIIPRVAFSGNRLTATLEWTNSTGTIKSVSVEKENREISIALFNAFTDLMEKARKESLIEESAWTQEHQIQAAKLVRPQLESLSFFSRAIDQEQINPAAATQLYREAMQIDPDFSMAYARLYYTYYESQPAAQIAESDLLSQSKIRLDPISTVWMAQAFHDLGVNAARRGWLTSADVYYRRTLALLASARQESSLNGALALFALGDLSLKSRNSISGLYHVHSAQESLETSGAKTSFLYMAGLIRLGACYVMDNKMDLALHSYEKAADLAKDLGLYQGPNGAIIESNLGLSYVRNNQPQKGIELQTGALKILSEQGFSNTGLYLTILIHLGNAYRFAGQIKEAERSFDQVIMGSRVLGLDSSIIYAEAMYSSGVLSMMRGDVLRAQYMMGSAQSTIAKMGYQRSAADNVPLELLPVRGDLGLTAEEARIVASYTGAFNYFAHTRNIQARTYEGRLDDTNVLLKDIFDDRKTDDQALNILREKLVGKPDRSGRGTVFIDVGPAIANLTMPGVTAVSLARDFPGMSVVGLDLPEQVDIFKQVVMPQLRARVLGFPNFSVLAGNGVHPLKKQIAERNSWVPPERQPGDLDGTPLIFRAANSIDIYETWESNARALNVIANDFPKSPILYFFNRSLLFKPAGSKNFRVIGLVSRAGFDHQYETFDRHGETAYTLSLAAFN